MGNLLSRLLSFFLPEPPTIEPGEEVVFVDVRTRPEWEQGHAAGARLIPHKEMDTRWTELRKHKDRRVLVYCRTGSRSRIAARVLRSRGFDRAENAGGIGALRRAGVEITTGA